MKTKPILIVHVAIFGELDMVVIFTGGNYVDASPNNEIIERHILPAVKDGDE